MSSDGVLYLKLLGPPRLYSGDTPVELRLRKAIALLALLAIDGEHKTRDTLATLFWADLGQSEALANLRRVLSSLRAAIGSECIDTAGETVALAREGTRVDVNEFRNALAGDCAHVELDLLEAAARRYTGEFLEGFGLKDCPDFDLWQYAQRESLRSLVVRALDSLSGRLLNEHEAERALEHAQRWLAIDELDERAHRRIVEIHSSLGHKGAAMRQFDRCVALLRAEGFQPDAATLELRARISSSSRHETAGSTGSRGHYTPSERHSRSELVGRADEITRLRRLLESARGGRGCVVVISGEPGCGKSMLAGAFADEASATGANVIWTRATEKGMMTPFATWRRTISSIEEAGINAGEVRPDGRPISATHPATLAELLGVEPGKPAQRLFEAASRKAKRNMGNDCLVILVEALEHATAESLELLLYLGSASESERLLIVGTRKDPSVYADSRATEVFGSIARLPRFTEIRLARLTRPGVAEYARAMVGEETDDTLVELLFSRSDGNFFHLAELVQLYQSEGLDAAAREVPARVKNVVAGKLESCSAPCRRLLWRAAVMGREFDCDTLGELSTGGSQIGVAETVTDGVRAGLIEKVGDRTARFVTELSRAATYQLVPPEIRSQTHQRIAQILARRPAGTDATLAARIAHHFRLSMNPEDSGSATRFFTAAGEIALARGELRPAINYLKDSLQMGRTVDSATTPATGAARDRAVAVALLGTAQSRLARQERRQDLLVEAAGNVVAAAVWMLDHGETDLLFQLVCDTEDAWCHFDRPDIVRRIVSRLDDDQIASLTSLAIGTGRAVQRRMARANRRRLRLARRHDDAATEYMVRVRQIRLCRFSLQLRRALRLSRALSSQLTRVALASDQNSRPAAGLDWSMVAIWYPVADRRVETAAASAARYLRMAEERGSSQDIATACHMLGVVRRAQGRFEEALGIATRGVQGSENDYRLQLLRLSCEFVLGRDAEASACLVEFARSASAELGLTPYPHAIVELGELYRLTGDVRLKNAAKDVAERAGLRGHHLWSQQVALQGESLIAAADGEAVYVRQLLRQMGTAPRWMGSSVVISTDRLRGVLYAASGRNRRAERYFRRAIAFAERHYPAEQAWACYDYADYCLRSSSRAVAAHGRELLEQAERLARLSQMELLLRLANRLREDGGM